MAISSGTKLQKLTALAAVTAAHSFTHGGVIEEPAADGELEINRKIIVACAVLDDLPRSFLRAGLIETTIDADQNSGVDIYSQNQSLETTQGFVRGSLLDEPVTPADPQQGRVVVEAERLSAAISLLRGSLTDEVPPVHGVFHAENPVVEPRSVTRFEPIPDAPLPGAIPEGQRTIIEAQPVPDAVSWVRDGQVPPVDQPAQGLHFGSAGHDFAINPGFLQASVPEEPPAAETPPDGSRVIFSAKIAEKPTSTTRFGPIPEPVTLDPPESVVLVVAAQPIGDAYSFVHFADIANVTPPVDQFGGTDVYSQRFAERVQPQSVTRNIIIPDAPPPGELPEGKRIIVPPDGHDIARSITGGPPVDEPPPAQEPPPGKSLFVQPTPHPERIGQAVGELHSLPPLQPEFVPLLASQPEPQKKPESITRFAIIPDAPIPDPPEASRLIASAVEIALRQTTSITRGEIFEDAIRLSHYRWYQDDNADEDATTAFVAEDTQLVTGIANRSIHLRVKLSNDGFMSNNQTFNLEFDLDGAGSWTPVTNSSNFIRYINGQPTGGAVTAERLTNTGLNYETGVYTELPGIGDTIAGQGETEYVHSLEIRAADFTGQQQVTFRQVTSAGLVIENTVVPTLVFDIPGRDRTIVTDAARKIPDALSFIPTGFPVPEIIPPQDPPEGRAAFSFAEPIPAQHVWLRDGQVPPDVIIDNPSAGFHSGSAHHHELHVIPASHLGRSILPEPENSVRYIAIFAEQPWDEHPGHRSFTFVRNWQPIPDVIRPVEPGDPCPDTALLKGEAPSIQFKGESVTIQFTMRAPSIEFEMDDPEISMKGEAPDADLSDRKRDC